MSDGAGVNAPVAARPLMALSQRLPPSNIQAEQALLGALLANNKAYDRMAAFLRPDHFADPVNGRIFAAIAARIDSGRLADVITLKADFEHAGGLAELGGAEYLVDLLGAMVGIINAGEYARAIRDAWHRRALIDIGETLVNAAFGGADISTAADVHEQAEAALFALGDRGDDGEAWSAAHEAMGVAIDAAVTAAKRPSGLIGITTGFTALDAMTGGWRRGQYVLLAARPSMGKTMLALAMAAGAAQVDGKVLFVSREMNREAIGAALAAGLAAVPRAAAERGKIRERDAYGRFVWTPIDDAIVNRMVTAARAMASRTLIVDECRAGTMAAVRAAARRQKRRGGLDLIVIDYLLLMRVPELARSDNRTLEISRLSADAKALAVDLDVPVLVLTQLNRGVEGREDKRPELSDLRDSGSLEQDADTVMFLYREHYYLRDRPPMRSAFKAEEKYADASTAWSAAEVDARGRADLIIRKQRRGPVGTIKLLYGDATTWFTDLPE